MVFNKYVLFINSIVIVIISIMVSMLNIVRLFYMLGMLVEKVYSALCYSSLRNLRKYVLS